MLMVNLSLSSVCFLFFSFLARDMAAAERRWAGRGAEVAAAVGRAAGASASKGKTRHNGSRPTSGRASQSREESGQPESSGSGGSRALQQSGRRGEAQWGQPKPGAMPSSGVELAYIGHTPATLLPRP